jgi:uncharacterized linocin/CFP29 family protein
MNDDLGRGQLGWSSDRWQALDRLAADTVNEYVVFRNLVEHREDIGARSARIAGRNVDVAPICSTEFAFNMEEEDDEDLDRRVRLYAQELAAMEDEAVLARMDLHPDDADINYKSFSTAKNALRNVRHGFGVVVSSDVLTDLETEEVGVKSGLDAVEQLLGTKVIQSSALPRDGVKAVVLQASPPAYRMVRGSPPRLRVVRIDNGNEVTLRLEESIGVGELEANRAIALPIAPRFEERRPAPVRDLPYGPADLGRGDAARDPDVRPD